MSPRSAHLTTRNADTRLVTGDPSLATTSEPSSRTDWHGGFLRPGDIVESCTGNGRFVIEALLGRGGFGQAYRALVDGARPGTMPAKVCVKVTDRLKSWICEAYFGFLLEGHPRSIRLYEALPLSVPARDFEGLYALVFELAQGGDLRDYLQKRGRPCTEAYARREMKHLLEVLDVLHSGRALHRDLTPFNVFVCERDELKLGDFGIAKHHHREGTVITALNRQFAPVEIAQNKTRYWRARDDVFQVGQLLAMLLAGNATRRLTAQDVRRLDCSDEMKEIIQRCIGTATKRFSTAGELVAALGRRPRAEKPTRVASLHGQFVVFTGRLAIERKDAARLATRAGATVQKRVTARTNVVIRGTPSPVQKAGAKGSKLIDVAFWGEKGVRIAVIGEKAFWRLVGRKPPSRPED